MPSIESGRKEVAAAGTAEQLGASESVVSVTLTAFEANTGIICVGGPTVDAAEATRTGIPLAAGDTASLEPHEVDDLGDVWIDAEVTDEGVSFNAVVP